MKVGMKTMVNREPLDLLLLSLRVMNDRLESPYLYGFVFPKDSAKDIDSKGGELKNPGLVVQWKWMKLIVFRYVFYYSCI